MKINKNEQGLGHLLLFVLVAVVVAAIGFAGWRVMNNKKSTDSTSATTTSSKQVWTNGDYAVAGTYADADVVKIAYNQWRLYYSIQPEVSGNRLEVYSATSTDGKTWTQEAGTRKIMATFPNVVKNANNTYRMYYQSAGIIKSAISTDGLTFADETGTRIDTSNDEGMVFDNVAAPTVLLKDDGTYMMVYRGSINTRYASDTPNATTQLLMWATSIDGLAWTKKGIAVDSRNSTLRGQLDGPYLVKWDDSKLHMFSTTYAGVYEFIFDGTKFDSGTLAYTLKSTQPAGSGPVQDVAPPGDPTVIKINSTWFMYYGGAHDENGIHYATLK